MLSGPPPPLFACNTQWKCIGGLTPPLPLGAYVINGRPLTETNTTYAKSWTSDRGSSPCLVSSGTLLCGRDLNCYGELKTNCSLVIMAASAMFEFNLTSNFLLQISLFSFFWTIMTVAQLWESSWEEIPRQQNDHFWTSRNWS